MATSRYFRYFTYIEPVIKTPFIRTYGSLILTILTLVIFIIFAIKPTIETILILQKQLSEQQQILDKLNQKSKNLSLGRKNYLSLDKTTQEKINFAIPTTPQIGDLTRVLEDITKSTEASISAIQFQNFSISPPQKKKILAEIPFNYNFESSYLSALTILSRLQSSSRLISIKQLQFSRTETGKVLITTSGKAYYLK